ncbi:hypothetical protein NBT05_12770 [Aquimarina sp. ERC-38]|uniref:hypothetical protein n=1 Tax=Aquimarina sp. ERC-38 TaxID=2949996 RepID=UPI0022480EB6|nr:hypothetical protein [Aquimarina sp. ERC-38]UZO79822.1 hypothetical protein NBT05_12770 [Aquimarina sp. ERC-38]
MNPTILFTAIYPILNPFQRKGPLATFPLGRAGDGMNLYELELSTLFQTKALTYKSILTITIPIRHRNLNYDDFNRIFMLNHKYYFLI